MFKNLFCTACFLGLLALFNNAIALSSDRQQPLYIQADIANLNHKTGISTYKGNVKLTQGTTVVTANSLVTYTDSKNKLQKAIAYGDANQHATYSTLPDDSKLVFSANAVTIEYYPQQTLVKLSGDAKATQGQDSYAGPQINYDMAKQTVTSPLSLQGRTSIIIQPDQKS